MSICRMLVAPKFLQKISKITTIFKIVVKECSLQESLKNQFSFINKVVRLIYEGVWFKFRNKKAIIETHVQYVSVCQ